MSQKYCRECGKALSSSETKFCKNCGTKRSQLRGKEHQVLWIRRGGIAVLVVFGILCVVGFAQILIENPTVDTFNIGGNTPTTPTTPTATPRPPTTVADTINAAYTKAGYKLIAPFTASWEGLLTYKGVVDDGPRILKPYRNDITIVMAPDRTSATKEYNAAIAQAQSKGYTKNIMDQDTSWYASTGTMTYPNQQVKITIEEPSKYVGVYVYGTDPFFVIDPNSYVVATDYQSPTS